MASTRRVFALLPYVLLLFSAPTHYARVLPYTLLYVFNVVFDRPQRVTYRTHETQYINVVPVIFSWVQKKKIKIKSVLLFISFFPISSRVQIHAMSKYTFASSIYESLFRRFKRAFSIRRLKTRRSTRLYPRAQHNIPETGILFSSNNSISFLYMS